MGSGSLGVGVRLQPKGDPPEINVCAVRIENVTGDKAKYEKSRWPVLDPSAFSCPLGRENSRNLTAKAKAKAQLRFGQWCETWAEATCLKDTTHQTRTWNGRVSLAAPLAAPLKSYDTSNVVGYLPGLEWARWSGAGAKWLGSARLGTGTIP